MASRARKIVSTTLAFSMIYGTLPTGTAMAGACGAGTGGGSGPPSISATEVSTTQALEILRRRKDQQLAGGGGVQVASLSQVAQPAAAAPPPPPPAATAQAAPAKAKVAKAAPAPQAAPAAGEPKAKKVVKKAAPKPAKATVVAAAAPAPQPYYGGSIKDSYVPATPVAVHGVWVQGYYDYERQGGWTLAGGNPGELKSKEQTTGVVTGFDRKVASRGDSTWLVGVLGGYQHSKTTYNDVSFLDVPADNADYLRINAHDVTEGGSFGLYTLLTSSTWSFDGLLKFDFLNYDQRDQFIQTNTNAGGCGANAGPWDRHNSSEMFNVVLAGNLARRYMHTSNSWFEPVAGFRYTHTSYGNVEQFINAPGGGPALPFGVTDGDVLRLQGGVRYGVAQVLSGDRVLITTVGGFLYSDVWIDGISQDYQDVVEGKLRVMGQLTTALSDPNGVTYLLQSEVRGGDDMFGVGVKAGIRYEW